MNIQLNFADCTPFNPFTYPICVNSHSGIYIWGFKFTHESRFLPYYVGIAHNKSIESRIIHHYANIPVNYKIFKSELLSRFYESLDNSALPKVKSPKKWLFYIYDKNNGMNKEQANADLHINKYLNNFYFTFAHPSCFECEKLIKKDYEFLETFVKYSLPNQTVSKAWSIDGKKFRQEMNNYSVIINKHTEINFKSTPSRF